jgi:WD40 repeat protein
LLHTLNKATDGSFALSSDGRLIALSGDKGLTLWDVASGRKLQLFGQRSNSQIAVEFSPDARYLVSADGSASRDANTLKLWDVASRKLIRTFSGHSSLVLSIAFSPDGRTLASSSSDKTLKLWDVSSGREIRTFDGQTSKVNSIAVSPDGRNLVWGNRDNKLRLWDIASGRQLRTFSKHADGIHFDGVNSVAFSPDSRTIVSGANDKTLKLWDAASGRELRTLNGHTEEVLSVIFSPDGRIVASGSNDKTLKLWDVASGRELRTLKSNNPVRSIAFSPDGRSIVLGNGDKDFKLWEVASGRELRTFKPYFGSYAYVYAATFSTDGLKIVSIGMSDMGLWDVASGKEVREISNFSHGTVNSVALSPDGRSILSLSRSILSEESHPELWDMNSGTEITSFSPNRKDVNAVTFANNGANIITGNKDGSVRTLDAATGKELAQFVSFTDGEWVTITPEGYYDSSEHGDKHLNVRIGEGLHEVYGIDQYRESFYRPDLVKIALGGGSLKDFRNIATVKASPQVAIVDTPASTSDAETKVTVKLTDMGGGIGDVRLYLNGSAVLLDNSRALKRVTTNDGKSVTRTYTLKLSNGKNSVRAIAFNADNSMQSTDALYEITASIKSASKPNLHAIVVGIKDFKNPKLNLEFPVADADLFADALQKTASGLFGKVEIKKLTTREETTSENIKKELAALRSLNPDDLFVFYVASHGTVDDGEFFLITSNVGLTSTKYLKSDALPQNELKELIANIPTTKKVIVLDTCNSGAMGDALQKAMLTRGMSEDTAIKILSRAVGSTILSASTSSQEALEGYNKHGLFTYVLVEGMKGKADKGKTGFIKTTDLVDYVDTEVPEIAEKVFKRSQFPTNTTSGQGFHIGKVR